MIAETSMTTRARFFRFCSLAAGKKAGILAIFSLFYFSDIVLRASGKFFWFDELYTVNICRLPSLGDVQQAVLHGVDYNPPLFYVMTRFAGAPFGYDLIGTRLPAIIGLWIACVCLFFLVAQRFGNTSGFISMMFPLMTVAKFYAYEARPHGIVVGCAGLAALAWQRVHTSSRRALWLFVLLVSLMVASFTHVYGVTLCLPIGMAELILGLRRRRLDWTVFAVIGMVPLAIAPSLLGLMKSYRVNVAGGGASFFPPHFSSVAHFYDFLLHPAISVIALCLALTLIARLYERDRSHAVHPESSFLDGNVVLAISFAALPVFAVTLAVLTKGPFIERYSVSAVIGVALIAGLGSASFSRQRWVSLCIAAILSCSFLMDTARLLKSRLTGSGEILVESSTSLQMSTTPGEPLDGHLLLATAEGTLPIVVLSSFDYPYFFEYGPKSLQPRLWYVAANEKDIHARLARCARDWCHMKYNVSTKPEFLRSNQHFMVYGKPDMLVSFMIFQNNIVASSIKSGGDYVLAELVVNK
jgi:hypothetical protein